MKVYQVIENGSWDYEPTFYTKTFSNFENALKQFENRAKLGEQDILEWCDKKDVKGEKNINRGEKKAYFELYEDGYFDKLHITISLNEIEVE